MIDKKRTSSILNEMEDLTRDEIKQFRGLKSLMSMQHIRLIYKIVKRKSPCNFLVFGVGKDSYIWNNANKNGNTVFLENLENWADKFDGLNVVKVSYKTTVLDYPDNLNEDKLMLDLPDDVLRTQWDVIVVDSPLGHTWPCGCGVCSKENIAPGRMSSIYTASKLAAAESVIVLDDFNRRIEHECGINYLGEDNLTYSDSKVAIFEWKSTDTKNTTLNHKYKVGFFVRHFTERGTEVAIYNYAHYNETILRNKSYIICFTPKAQGKHRLLTERTSFCKFNERFEVIEINDISEMKEAIKTFGITHFFTRSHGKANTEDFYELNNKNIWHNCKTIYQCVFYTTEPQGDVYCSIGSYLNDKHKTNISVLPGHMVIPPSTTQSLRKSLNIPERCIVVGRYGGHGTFNIDFVHSVVYNFAKSNPNVYFIFMNTKKFCDELPNIIHLPKVLDVNEKTKFINTCDAMLHARNNGETFGAAVAEFSSCNKPVITFKGGNKEHLYILGEKAITYKDAEELFYIFNNVSTIINSRKDWNAYAEYTPEKIMKRFAELVFENNDVKTE